LPAVVTAAGGIAARAVVDRLGLAEPRAATSFALRQPLPTVTGWPAPAGPSLLALWFVTIALALVPFVVLLRRPRPDATRAIVVAAVALAVAAASWPVVWSSDVLAYAAYGREALHGLSPYGTRPLDPTDPVFAATIVQWGNPPPPCVYGPLFLLAAAGAALAAGDDPFRLVLLLRALAIVGFGFAVYFAARLGGRTAALAIGLNPVLAWTAAEGHNDALALAGVLGGLVLLRRSAAGAFVVALAALVKAPAFFAAGALVRERARGRRAALLGLACAGAGSIPIALGLLAHRADASVESWAAFGLPSLAKSFGGGIGEAAAIVLILAFGGILALRRDRRSGYAFMGLAVWFALPNAYAWYGIWLAALVPLARDPWLRGALVVATIAASVRYLPDALANPPPGPLVTLALTLPVLIAVVVRRPVHPETP
jgi:hypothetical protein